MRPLEIFALTLFELRVQFLRARGVRPIKRIADSYRLPRNDILRGARSLPKAESKIHQPQEKRRNVRRSGKKWFLNAAERDSRALRQQWPRPPISRRSQNARIE